MWPLFLGSRPFNWKILVKSIKRVWSPKIKATWTFINVVIWQKRILFYSALLELGIFFYTIETRGWGKYYFFLWKEQTFLLFIKETSFYNFFNVSNMTLFSQNLNIHHHLNCSPLWNFWIELWSVELRSTIIRI